MIFGGCLLHFYVNKITIICIKISFNLFVFGALSNVLDAMILQLYKLKKMVGGIKQVKIKYLLWRFTKRVA